MKPPTPPYLSQAQGRTRLRVKVQPRATRDEIVGPQGDALKVRVTAPPVDAAANEALLRFLATELKCGRRQLTLIRGGRSRHKIVEVAELSLAQVAERLALQRRGTGHE